MVDVYERALDPVVFSHLSDVADKLGVNAYVVGGYVRDFFLGIPNDDIDIVVEGGSGLDFAKVFGEMVGGEVQLYENYGTAKVHYSGGEVEFVGCRREAYERGSRKPIVEEGTLSDDLNRRDFTINAMAFSINKKTYGYLVDKFNGISDLKHGIIRCVGTPDDRFSEDPLRIWRMVRFKCKLSRPDKEFHYDISTFDAAKRNAYRNEILSKERIVEEFDKIMKTQYAPDGVRALKELGLLKLTLPEVDALSMPDDKGHKDVFEHTMQVLWNVCQKSDDLYLRWAALLHDIGKVPTRKFEPGFGWTFYGHAEVGAKMVEKIFRRMKMPTDTRMGFVMKMVAMHMRPNTLAEEGVTDSAIRRLLFDAGDDIEKLMILCKSDVTTRYENKRQRIYENMCKIEERMAEIEEKDAIRNFKNPVDGYLVMGVYGLKPCKEISVIKDAVKDAILDGKIPNDYNAAVGVMKEKAKEIGLTPVPDAEKIIFANGTTKDVEPVKEV